MADTGNREESPTSSAGGNERNETGSVNVRDQRQESNTSSAGDDERNETDSVNVWEQEGYADSLSMSFGSEDNEQVCISRVFFKSH